MYSNGLGGFTPDGREYVVVMQSDDVSPTPWSNILSNEQFGTLITESGGGYTWFLNAHEFRLTPWRNDPVVDPAGEFLYIRDEETGLFWSPVHKITRTSTHHVCRHGQGYTTFEHASHEIYSEVKVCIAKDAPVKLFILKLRNESDKERRLSVTAFCEWVLGQNRDETAMHIVTRVDPQTSSL